LPAGPAAVAGALAIQALGACAVEINRDLDAATIAAVLRQTGARHAIVHGRDAARWAELAVTRDLVHLHVVHPSAPPARMQEILSGRRWTWVAEHEPAGGVGWDAPVRDRGATALLVY